jgi:EAL domain-containing protein (putative c-di-GMP-specific phosphodiesterase class I)
LASALAHYPHIDPADLELEILETNALEDIGAVSTVMHDCHRLGVRFAIDDFGTGYSSLTYLKRLPAETLKIDQSFVRDMLTDREDMAIVQNVIGLAESFHRMVIAEGVETMAHGQQLIKMGCLYAQGYGIAKPMPPQDLPEWILRWRAGFK